MKGVISVIEVMITGIILIIAFLHFFPQYSVKTEWDRVLLATEVMDTMNTIDRLDKTYVFATCSTAFNDFMGNLFTPETSGAMIWWKETEGLSGYKEDMRVPYFEQGYKESMVDSAGEVVLFEDDFNYADGVHPPGWTEEQPGNWIINKMRYFGDASSGKELANSTVNVNTEDNIIIEVTTNETSACCAVFIIFDYQHPDGFKYAGLHFWCPSGGNREYEIGYYDSTGFNHEVVVPAVAPLPTFEKNETHRLKVKIHETSKVTLYFDGVEITNHIFSSMGTGDIGLSVYGGADAYFDDFIIKKLVYDAYTFTLGLGYPY